MSKSLKASATSGIFWSAVEKFSVQAGQTVIYIVLARLLMPEDFGLIGMLAILLPYPRHSLIVAWAKA